MHDGIMDSSLPISVRPWHMRTQHKHRSTPTRNFASCYDKFPVTTSRSSHVTELEEYPCRNHSSRLCSTDTDTSIG